MPGLRRTASSSWREWPRSRAWRRAAGKEMTTSPRRFLAGPSWTKASTSVVRSFRRQRRLSRRISRSDTSATLSSARSHAKALTLFLAVLEIQALTVFGLLVRSFIRIGIAFLLQGHRALLHRLRVIGPGVIHGPQHLVERLGDGVQVLEGELALIQLAAGEDAADDLLDHALDAGVAGLAHGAGRGLHRVGQHHDPGFPRLRLGPRGGGGPRIHPGHPPG